MEVNKPLLQQCTGEIPGFRRVEYQKEHPHDPPPTDDQLGAPMNAMLVSWDTGYIAVDLERLKELPVRQRTAIMKLGGLR